MSSSRNVSMLPDSGVSESGQSLGVYTVSQGVSMVMSVSQPSETGGQVLGSGFLNASVDGTNFGDGGRAEERVTATSSPPLFVMSQTQTHTQRRRPRPTAVQLAEAVLEGDEGRVEGLLAGGVNINGTVRGETVLHIAARMEGEVGRQMVEVLVDHGAKIDEEDSAGATPPMVAFLNGRAESLAVLLDRMPPKAVRDFAVGKTVEEYLYTRKVWGVLTERAIESLTVGPETMKALVERLLPQHLYVVQPGTEHSPENLLRCAVRKVWSDLIPVLVGLGVDVNEAFMLAVKEEKEDIIQLLGTGGKPASHTFTRALEHCVHSGKGDMIPILAGMGADLNAGYTPPLHLAIQCRFVDCFRKLISAGADISLREKLRVPHMTHAAHYNFPQPASMSALLDAIVYKRGDMVDALLDAGAKWTREDEEFCELAYDRPASLCRTPFSNVDPTLHVLLQKVRKSF